MATKKFVKSEMFNSNKYTEKPEKAQKSEKPWNNSNQYAERPKRQPNQYVERGGDGDLRKYFEFIPTSAIPQVQKLIHKFPIFFCEQSQGWESAHNKYHGRPERNAPVAIAQPEEEEIVSWDSEGQIDLGVGVLDKSSLKRYEGAAPLKINELKKYEKQFLEDIIRKKAEEEQKNKQKQSTVTKDQPKLPVIQTESFKKVKKSSCQMNSDDEIQIVKTTNYEARPQQPIKDIHQTPQKSQSIMTDEEGQDDRFKDSSGSEDIFGDNSEEEDNKQQIIESTPPKQAGMGFVQFAKGEFGVFALSQGLKPDDEVWALSDGSSVSKKFSSAEMDQNYINVYSRHYPLINFNDYPQYIEYSTFSQTRSIESFLPPKQQINNYNHKFDHQQSKKNRKYSNNQHHNEDNNKHRNRRQSTTAVYKPKKNDNDSL